MILMHPTEREKGINLRFPNVVSGDTIVAGLGARVSYTAAIGGNPDIEPTSPQGRVWPNSDIGRRLETCPGSHATLLECYGLAVTNAFGKHDYATTIKTNDVERVLTDINADYGNRTLCCRSHGVLLVLAPLASLSLAGQEHGRTIPLTDIE